MDGDDSSAAGRMNSLCPVTPFVAFVTLMQSVVEFDNVGLRYGRAILALIPLAVMALAMLMARMTVISALKRIL